MKIIMFEENLVLLKQEFHDSLSRDILKTFWSWQTKRATTCLLTNHHVVKVSIKPFVYQICHFVAL